MTGVISAVTVGPGVLRLACHGHPRVVGRDGGVRSVGRHRVLGLHPGVRGGEGRVLVAHHLRRGCATLGRSWKTGDGLLLDDGADATPAHGLVLVDHRVEVLDVVHGRGQDLHSADLLLVGGGGDCRP